MHQFPLDLASTQSGSPGQTRSCFEGDIMLYATDMGSEMPPI
jgi:hypothetical protein